MSAAKEPFGGPVLPRPAAHAAVRFPQRIRRRHGRDLPRAARRHGAPPGNIGVWKMWWATIADIVRMAPREHVSVLAQDTRYALRMMRKNRAYTLAAVAHPRARHRRQHFDLQRGQLGPAQTAALYRRQPAGDRPPARRAQWRHGHAVFGRRDQRLPRAQPQPHRPGGISRHDRSRCSAAPNPTA